MVQSTLLFGELDTLDLAGLGIGDEGAKEMAKTLSQNPNMRRCNLADNKIGEEGGSALAAALALNTSLQVRSMAGAGEVRGQACGPAATATVSAWLLPAGLLQHPG
jgi:Ran GTPase-activating protein (RanGAP) involved in mRNA processing and transport